MIQRFVGLLKDFGMEYFNRWYGWYAGEVVSVADPDDQGRIRVRVPILQIPEGEDTLPNWAYPMFGPFCPGPDKGSYNVPCEGDSVWVCFQNGDPSLPMYAATGWFAQSERPAEFESVDDRGWKTHSGHVVRFRDTEGDESILIQHRAGGKIEFDVDDKVTIETNAGDVIILDPSGSILIQHRAGTRAELDTTSVEVQASARATIKAPSITLEGGNVQLAAPGAVHPVPKGDVLMIWLEALHKWAVAHTHVVVPGAPGVPVPSAPALPPAVPPPTASILSTKTKTG